MMRMGADIVRELDVALQAHAVRIAGEFQRCRIVGSAFRMRLVTVPAMRLSLAEAGCTPECFHDEGCFAKPSVFIESAPREIAIRLAQVGRVERYALSGIIDLAIRPRLMQRGLCVALTANRDILARPDPVEVNRSGAY